jgi:diguanylate cyclase (GGDEF)-like protein
MSTSTDFSRASSITDDAPTALEAEDQPPEAKPRPCILLVEDSPTTLSLLSKPLSEDYSPLAAHDGVDAWKLLQAHPEIELVITDLEMPHMSGQELLVKIRQNDNPLISNLPVIVIAAAAEKHDRNLAFKNGANDFVNKPIDSAELQARVRVHHKLARTIRELEMSRRALAEQATTDPLTRLQNRRAFFQEGRQGFALSQRSRHSLSVMELDIDHFKRVNDRYGHQAGDRVLTRIARLLSRMSRSVDTVARIGGEEFAIILPETDRGGAAVLAERIRAAAADMPFHACGRPISLTISIGVATSGNDDADSITALLGIADRRLYVAKKRGRNRVCVADDADA